MATIELIGWILLIIGIALIGLEMFVPGFGFPGISGTIAVVAGIILKSKTVEEGLTTAAIVIVILAVMLAAVVVFFHTKKIKSPLILDKELTKDPGFIDSEDLNYLIGKEGVTASILRPAGRCDIDGVYFEVRSDGEYIEKGKKVKIIRIENSMIIVKEC